MSTRFEIVKKNDARAYQSRSLASAARLGRPPPIAEGERCRCRGSLNDGSTPRQQIASGLDGGVSVAVMVYALLLFVPLSLALRYIFDAPPAWVFLTGAAAIAVLADWLRRATDQLAERAGSTIGLRTPLCRSDLPFPSSRWPRKRRLRSY